MEVFDTSPQEPWDELLRDEVSQPTPSQEARAMQVSLWILWAVAGLTVYQGGWIALAMLPFAALLTTGHRWVKAYRKVTMR
jgi:hypothetical protein